jgi:Ca2+-binding RTX toxin-like protein
MANVYLYEPNDMSVPQLSIAEFERRYGPFQIYSITDTEAWAGTGEFGSELDVLYDVQGNTITGVAAWFAGTLDFSIDGIRLDANTAANGIGKPLHATGIFDGNDLMVGSYGNDVIIGSKGADELYGEGGNDTIIGGHGRDSLNGGANEDSLYGGFGFNTFMSEQDGSVDKIFFRPDQSTGNSQNARIDIIEGLDPFDEIYVQGLDSSSLSFSQVDGGIGIFDNGYLEAVYTGGNLSADQLSQMTSVI